MKSGWHEHRNASGGYGIRIRSQVFALSQRCAIALDRNQACAERLFIITWLLSPPAPPGLRGVSAVAARSYAASKTERRATCTVDFGQLACAFGVSLLPP
jgi:hypothetical protein